MKYVLSFLVLALALGTVAGDALAQRVNPSMAIHVAPRGSDLSKACTGAPANCAAINTTGPTVPDGGGPAYWIYLVALPKKADGTEGVTGMAFGIWYEYNNVGGVYTGAYVDPGTFVRCSELAFLTTNWPQPGSGASLTWSKPPVTNCPKDQDFRVGGAMEVSLYSAALMQLTPHPAGNREFAITDCDGSTGAISYPAGAGWVSFGGRSSGGDTDGCNPCNEACPSVAVENNTWSKIKQTFGHGE